MGESVIHIPWWKRFWSYFSDVLIEHQVSEFQDDLYLLLSKGRYQLCTDDAIYSYDDKYENFTGLFDQLRLDRLPGKKVLILGMGLASIPYILEYKLALNHFKYDCVEIDEAVVSLASKYSLPRLQSQVNTIIADAEQYVNYCNQQYDMICVDIFHGTDIPLEFQSHDFLSALSDICSHQGLIVINRLAFTNEDQQASQRYFDQVFSSKYSDASLIPVKGNYMLINDSRYL